MGPATLPPPRRETLPLPWAAGILLAAVLAQAWFLGLAFQLEDFLLLDDPWALFPRDAALKVALDYPPFMVRFTQWGLWGVLRAILPEPLSPVPYHAVGLLLHGLTALWVARVVLRLAPRVPAADAAVAAGLVFGLCAGHVQAASWISAWSGSLGTLLGLTSLEAFLHALGLHGRRRLAFGALGALLAWLSLVSKAPFLTVVPLVALALVASQQASGERRLPGKELAFLGLALGLALLTRVLYLGSLNFGYNAARPPGLAELPRLLPNGLSGLGQALYPWNRDPLFAGEAPLLARLTGEALPAPALGWLAFGPWILAALLVGRGRRRALLVAVALALGALVPIAVLYQGIASNLASRAAYLPMTAAAGLVGLSIAVLAERAVRRPVLLLAAVLLGAVLLDGTYHVARTELLAADETRELQRLVDEAAREHGRSGSRLPLTVLVHFPRPDFANIPHLGEDQVAHAFRPPFVADAVDVRGAALEEELAGWLARGELADHDVLLLGPGAAGHAEAGDVESLGEPTPGARARADRLPRRRSPRRAGSASESLGLGRLAPDRFAPPEPQSLHAFPALALAFDAGPVAGRWTFERSPDVAFDLPLELATGGDATCRVPADLGLLLGEPVRAVSWSGSAAPSSVALRRTVERLEALEPAPAAVVEVGPTTGPLVLRARRPPGSPARAARARVRLRIRLAQELFLLEAELPAGASEELLLAPASYSLRDTPQPFPWEVLRAQLLDLFENQLLRSLSFTWSLRLTDGSGTVLAETSPTAARFVPATGG